MPNQSEDYKTCPWRTNNTYCTQCSGHEHLCTHESQIESLQSELSRLTRELAEKSKMLDKMASALEWAIDEATYPCSATWWSHDQLLTEYRSVKR